MQNEGTGDKAPVAHRIIRRLLSLPGIADKPWLVFVVYVSLLLVFSLFCSTLSVAALICLELYGQAHFGLTGLKLGHAIMLGILTLALNVFVVRFIFHLTFNEVPNDPQTLVDLLKSIAHYREQNNQTGHFGPFEPLFEPQLFRDLDDWENNFPKDVAQPQGRTEYRMRCFLLKMKVESCLLTIALFFGLFDLKSKKRRNLGTLVRFLHERFLFTEEEVGSILEVIDLCNRGRHIENNIEQKDSSRLLSIGPSVLQLLYDYAQGTIRMAQHASELGVSISDSKLFIERIEENTVRSKTKTLELEINDAI